MATTFLTELFNPITPMTLLAAVFVIFASILIFLKYIIGGKQTIKLMKNSQCDAASNKMKTTNLTTNILSAAVPNAAIKKARRKQKLQELEVNITVPIAAGTLKNNGGKKVNRVITMELVKKQQQKSKSGKPSKKAVNKKYEGTGAGVATANVFDGGEWQTVLPKKQLKHQKTKFVVLDPLIQAVAEVVVKQQSVLKNKRNCRTQQSIVKYVSGSPEVGNSETAAPVQQLDPESWLPVTAVATSKQCALVE